MSRRFRGSLLLLFVIATVSFLFVAVSCSSEEEATPTAAPTAVPTKAPTAVPPTAVPTAKPAATATAKPAATATAKPAATATPGAFKYNADDYRVEGAVWTWFWDGPIPPSSTWKQSPMNKAMEDAGQIPPLKERVPADGEIHVVPPPDEIGVYGGTLRNVGAGVWGLGGYSEPGCVMIDVDGRSGVPMICKSYEISADGRTYTFNLRKGARWSDGVPITIEDFRFAFEDINLNTEYSSSLSPTYVDLVTGNPVKFTVVDDWTFTLSFDTPNFIVLDEVALFDSRCFPNDPAYCYEFPAHYGKQFHPKYQTPAKLQELMDEAQVDDWAKLFGLRTNYETNGLNTKYPVPHAGPWVTESRESNGNFVDVRNPYYFGFDPEGNQLPYIDRIQGIQVESREVGVFRAMNGEVDSGGIGFILTEMPLYMQNMVSGDYSIYKWDALAGDDSYSMFNQDYNVDPEVGRWLRTKDFRIALSVATDRNKINDVVFLEAGVPHNGIPPYTHMYYPGAEYEQMDAMYDPARSKSILAGLGLKDTDGDGFLNRLDGKGNLTLSCETSEGWFPVLLLLQEDYAAVGIKIDIKQGSTWSSKIAANEEYYELYGALYDDNPWAASWIGLMPIAKGARMAPLVAEWYATRGKSGMNPNVANSAYLPAAPAGNYPSDPNGTLKKLQDLKDGGKVTAPNSPERIEVGKEIFQTVVSEKLRIGTVGFTGIFRGIYIKRNNVRNVPEKHWPTQTGGKYEVRYFEDGIDNVSHPGNKSKKYKSTSFLTQ